LLESLLTLLVPGIKYSPERLEERSWPKELLVLMDNGTCPIAAGAQDAPDRLGYLLALLRALQPLSFRRARGNEVGPDQVYFLEKRGHIDDEVLQDLECRQRLHHHFHAFIVFQKLLACQGAQSIDVHGV
jgi:hypothetical protein